MQILPFYLLCDESGSMAGSNVDALNDALPKLHDEISTNPTVADKTRFCLIGFSTEANVLQPLVDLSDIDEVPALAAGGLTSFGNAFRTLLRCIETDVAALKAEGHEVYRPVAFFMSDGVPTDDDWPQAYKELTESATARRSSRSGWATPRSPPSPRWRTSVPSSSRTRTCRPPQPCGSSPPA
ncbi:VWA domain-containing protein [Streptomyces diastatochromogenes]|nr:VWA domain-containing protein [Streptomyces diastatochromogenes]